VVTARRRIKRKEEVWQLNKKRPRSIRLMLKNSPGDCLRPIAADAALPTVSGLQRSSAWGKSTFCRRNWISPSISS